MSPWGPSEAAPQACPRPGTALKEPLSHRPGGPRTGGSAKGPAGAQRPSAPGFWVAPQRHSCLSSATPTWTLQTLHPTEGRREQHRPPLPRLPRWDKVAQLPKVHRQQCWLVKDACKTTNTLEDGPGKRSLVL